MLRGTSRSDLILAAFVVAVLALLLLPLPTFLLDILLVLNLAFGLILLLAGLYLPNALSLLAFPALLLLTTLLRLSLSVASTRLILSQADAGRVIEAFGTFLIGGEIEVGIIIFCIFTIVNFIVISRGSIRVSEVAARFALDALPGKQMAIDADLRAGILTAEQAQAKREDLRRESQLYGAMDGAMKFVQGDAIAGFFIIFANVIGGLYLGLKSGMSFNDAVSTYVTLTIGDGLVHQIPAVMISVCAGIVVTRVASADNSTLGSDLSAQLFNRPGVLFFVGTVLMVVGTFSSLPILPFLLVGVMLIAASLWLHSSQGKAERESQASNSLLKVIGMAPRYAEQLESDSDKLVIKLDVLVLNKLYKLGTLRYLNWWRLLQLDFFENVGLRLPEISVVADSKLGAACYQVLFNQVEILAGDVYLDGVVVEVSPDCADCFGLEIGRVEFHPVSKQQVFWAPQTPRLRKVAEAAHLRTFDFFEFIGLSVAEFFRRNPDELLGVSDVFILLKQLEKKYPGLYESVIATEFINVARLTDILRALVREGLNVRELKSVVEGVASYCSSLGGRELGRDDFDLNEIIKYFRLGKKRQLLAQYLTPRKTLRVVSVSEGVERHFAKGEHSLQRANQLEPDVELGLISGLVRIVEPIVSRGLMPIVLLCPQELRLAIAEFIQRHSILLAGQVAVFSFDELDVNTRIEPLALWRP